jgi:arginase
MKTCEGIVTPIAIIGAPIDLGEKYPEGLSMGPKELRNGSALAEALSGVGRVVKDYGDIYVPIRGSLPKPMDKKALYSDVIAEASRSIGEVVFRALEDGCFPLILGGDHSIAIGSIAGVAKHFRARGQKIGVIWVDAHPDINTPETSPTGNIHGMPLAFCLGYPPEELSGLMGFSPKVEGHNIAIVGARDFDPQERETIETNGVALFESATCVEAQIRKTMHEAIARACEGTAGFHLSFDIDFIDPSEAPAVGTPFPDGATSEVARIALEVARDSGKMISMDVVEVNPVLDKESEGRTLSLAVELIIRALRCSSRPDITGSLGGELPHPSG